MVGSWNVPDGIKMTADAYVAFLRGNLEPWLKKERAIISKNDNTSTNVTYKTIRQLWTFEDELARQFARLKPNWKLVVHFQVTRLREWMPTQKQLLSEITSEEIQKMTSSMDMRLIQVISIKRIIYRLLTSSTIIFNCVLVDFYLFCVVYCMCP